MTETTEAPQTTYKDDDLVYVDPNLRTVVGRVEFLPNGKSKPLAMKTPMVDDTDDDADPKVKGRGRRPQRVRYYPWGTYRSMKRIYKIEGKQAKEESRYTLDQVIEKALKEPFWE